VELAFELDAAEVRRVVLVERSQRQHDPDEADQDAAAYLRAGRLSLLPGAAAGAEHLY
jgi:hypothetical protein